MMATGSMLQPRCAEADAFLYTDFDVEQEKQSLQQNRMLLKWPTSIIIGGSVLSIMMILGYSIVVLSSHHPPLPSMHYTNITCGHSSQEAISRGCHFDVTSFSWLPGPCYDAELADEFASLTDWHWYRDEEGMIEVPHDIIIQGNESTLFVSMRYHVVHCAYTYRKLQRAVVRGSPIDDYIGKPGHAEHCAQMIIRSTRESLDELNTVINLHFPTCPVELSKESF